MNLERVMSTLRNRGQAIQKASSFLSRRAKSTAAPRGNGTHAVVPAQFEPITHDPPIRRMTTPAGDAAWLVSGYRQVKELASDPRVGMSHPDLARAAHYSDAVIYGHPMGDSASMAQVRHEWLRRALSPTFSARRVEELRPRVQELVDTTLDEMERQPRPVDFHDAVSIALPVRLTCMLLDIPYSDHKDFVQWADDASDWTDRARSEAALARLQDYMRPFVEHRLRDPGADVLSDLIRARQRNSEGITDHDLVSYAVGLLYAGFGTTVPTLDKAAILLLTDPAVREAFGSDSTLHLRAVEELLRFPMPLKPSGDPVPFIIRYALTDFEIAQVDIRAGDLIVMPLEDANMDPSVFPEPHTFHLAHDATPHLRFSWGMHYCIGAPLARIEMQILFRELVQRYPTLRLAVPVEALRYRTNLITGGVMELPVTW